MDGVYSIFDTGVGSIYISRLWYDGFVDELARVAKEKLFAYNSRLYSRCSNNFPSIFFLISGIYIEVAPKDYISDVSREKDGSVCLIHFQPSDSPFLIFGMPLFVDYTTVFDDQASIVGFKPTVGSEKVTIREGVVPMQALRLPSDFELS